MELTPILIVLIIFSSIVAIILGPGYFKSREKQAMQEIVRAAIDKGEPMPPEMIDALTKEAKSRIPSAARDLRVGVILVAVSIGIALFGYAFSFVGGIEEAKAVYPIVGMGAIPGAVGVAFIILSFFNKNKD
ncbi:DUF6249 domain-containing protein [Brevundimonas sp. VNH65]|uniref:DUF6249 domain-containing protein n=1 Tax=Brevundimonas sp. VNH65 TaxID=3400917 RepID=UPI003C05216C